MVLLKELVAFILGVLVGGGGMLIYMTFVKKN